MIPGLFRLSADNLRISTLREMAARAYNEGRADETTPVRDEELDALLKPPDEDGHFSEKDHTDMRAGYVDSVEQTFIETTRDETHLTEKPISKAPKYAQAMEHGHRAGTFTNKET